MSGELYNSNYDSCIALKNIYSTTELTVLSIIWAVIPEKRLFLLFYH